LEHNLRGDVATVARVVGTVHHGHTAATELGREGVAFADRVHGLISLHGDGRRRQMRTVAIEDGTKPTKAA